MKSFMSLCICPVPRYTRPSITRICVQHTRTFSGIVMDCTSVAAVVSAQGFAKLIGRCSDGVEDQGAEEAFMGPRENRLVSFESLFLCEQLSFQPQSWNVHHLADGVCTSVEV